MLPNYSHDQLNIVVYVRINIIFLLDNLNRINQELLMYEIQQS